MFIWKTYPSLDTQGTKHGWMGIFPTGLKRSIALKILIQPEGPFCLGQTRGLPGNLTYLEGSFGGAISRVDFHLCMIR